MLAVKVFYCISLMGSVRLSTENNPHLFKKVRTNLPNETSKVVMVFLNDCWFGFLLELLGTLL